MMKLNERQLTRAIYSLWDFQQALSGLTFLLEDCDYSKSYTAIELRRFRCYEATVIISMARPFEKSRNGTTLNLGALGIRLDQAEKRLIDRVMLLRRKIVAHSDEDEMHFRASTFPVLEGEFNFPRLQFDETLYLDEADLRGLELLLRKLKHDLAAYFFKLAQEDPGFLEKHKTPERLQEGPADA